MFVNQYEGNKFENGAFRRVSDGLVVEEALRISINGTPFTVTMRTPGNDEELIRGLLFSEDFYAEREGAIPMEILKANRFGVPTAVNLFIPEEKISMQFLNGRHILSVSSCGICGKTELEMPEAGETAINSGEILHPSVVADMFQAMNAVQQTFQQSGGSHAAGAFTLHGELLAVREDIGRHNAVDKVIGRLLLDGNLEKARVLTVSGRISYEIVSKCFVAEIPFLAAVSAPSSLAVDFAKELGITLMAFCRGEKLTVYSNAECVLHQQQ